MGTNYLGRTRDFNANNPTWDNVPIPTVTRCLDFILDPWNPKNGGWLSTDNGVYKTANLDASTPSWTLALSKSTIEASLGATNFGNAYKVIGSINKQYFFALFFTAYSGGVYSIYCARTSDNGSTWDISTVVSGEQDSWAGAVDYVPHLVNGSVVFYVGAIDFFGSPPSERGMVLKSTNSGATWSNLGSLGSYGSLNSSTPYSAHCPYDDNTDGQDAFVAFGNGIWRSINGSTFVSLGKTPQTNISRTSVETYTQNQNILYIWNSSDNIEVSENSGVSYTTRGSVPGTIKAAGGFPFNSQRYYAVSDNGIYASFDGGTSFVNKTNNYPVSQLSPSASYNKAVIVPVWVA